VIASNGSVKGAIRVVWKSIKAAEYYALYRLRGSTKTWKKVDDSLKSTIYFDRDISLGENYFYKVKVRQYGKWGKFSAHDRGFAKLATPLGLEAFEHQLYKSIMIRWKEVKERRYYDLFRSKYPNRGYKKIQSEIKKSHYIDRDVKIGEHYYYKVKAINRLSSETSHYQEAHLSLKTPKHLMATDASKSKIFISWEYEKENVLFDLYRSLKKSEKYSKVAENLTQKNYQDKNVIVGKDYYYKVKAKQDSFESPFSDVDSGYVVVDFPSAIKASNALSAYYIDLKWRSKSVDYFKIFRAEKAKGVYLLIADKLQARTYRDRNISYCKNYYYKVQSFKNGKLSRLSSWDSGYGKCGAFVDTFSGTGFMGDKNSNNRQRADFNRPTGLALSGKSIYIADTFNHKIRMIDASHKTSTFAGTGEVGSEDGSQDRASFYRPTGIAVAKDGTIYIAEIDNHIIRRVSPDGKVTTFAGTGVKGDRDGQAKQAQFNKPFNLIVNTQGDLYVTELGNHKVRKITADGMVTTYTGKGYQGKKDGALKEALFNQPRGIVMDRKGRIYIADSNNNTIRQIDEKGRVRSFAGGGRKGDQDGKGVAASFNDPRALAIDSQDNIYVADTGNHKIRMITPRGIVKTIAGSSQGGDRDGFETEAAFFSPRGIAVDGDNHIYVSDFHAHKIRKITILSKEDDSKP